MKLGLLADIHEHDEELRNAIGVLEKHGTDRSWFLAMFSRGQTD